MSNINELILNNYGYYITMFAAFSFLGWAMECIVIKKELGYWENRGFAKAPFCAIYGFGIMILYPVINQFSNNLWVLFILGSLIATLFEYLVAIGMNKMFDRVWWDYTHKSYNYKGILCLESTIGWGVGTIVIAKIIYPALSEVVTSLPIGVTNVIGISFQVLYILDVIVVAYKTRRESNNEEYESI
ncbi:MAG: putative ABC transporter permease [Anaerovoracaceae bacterium]